MSEGEYVRKESGPKWMRVSSEQCFSLIIFLRASRLHNLIGVMQSGERSCNVLQGRKVGKGQEQHGRWASHYICSSSRRFTHRSSAADDLSQGRNVPV
jgi:hypothetical protein